MEDESSEDISDSDLTGSFISINDDYLYDELTWNSDDSRPPAPTPPSSESPAVRHRLRRRARRNVFVESETQSDEESLAVSQVSTVSESNPPSPTVSTFMIHESADSSPLTINDSADSTFETDSDVTAMPSSPPRNPPSVEEYLGSPRSLTHSPDVVIVPHSPAADEAEVVDPPIQNMHHFNAIFEQFLQNVMPVQNNVMPVHIVMSDDDDGGDHIVVNVPDNLRRMVDDTIAQIGQPANPQEVLDPPLQNDQSAVNPHEVLDPPLQNDQPANPQIVLDLPLQNDQPAANQLEALDPPLQNDQSANDTEPPPLQVAAAPELNNSLLSDSEDNSLCSICMDPLTNSGKHRVVCLRCGHIFGQSCLERWIKVGCNNGAKRCPTCNKKACLRDIRVLYLPKVVPLDTVERDRLVQEKEELIAQKNILEMELSKCRLQQQLSVKKSEEKIAKLEKELHEVKHTLKKAMKGKPVADVNGVKLEKDVKRADLLHSIDLSKEGGCRVLAYSPILHELVVSQPSGNTVFSGFGVRVLNSVDFQPTRFMFLHSKMIRDLAFHPEERSLLLSVSLDQTAKLVDLSSTTTVHTFKGEGPLWSCCWDVSNPHLMLVGSQNGQVCQYDRRMVDHYVNIWTTDNNMTPVVSLASMPIVAQTPFPQGGFLSCRLNKVIAYARHGVMHNSQELPLTGPFMSMRYDHVSQNLLTSSRPSSACSYVRIGLNLLDVDETGNVCLPEIHTFNCGLSARFLSRVTSVPTLNDSLIIAHHESGRTVNLWSSKTGNLVQSILIKEPVIDLCNLSFNNSKCLFASLSEKTVSIYKVT